MQCPCRRGPELTPAAYLCSRAWPKVHTSTQHAMGTRDSSPRIQSIGVVLFPLHRRRMLILDLSAQGGKSYGTSIHSVMVLHPHAMHGWITRRLALHP
jgi:hypothetical protein